MVGNGRQNAFSAVRPPFVRPTAVQHFYADDNDENGDVNDDRDYRNTNDIANGNIKLPLDLWIMLLFDTDNTMLPRASSRRERVQEKSVNTTNGQRLGFCKVLAIQKLVEAFSLPFILASHVPLH